MKLFTIALFCVFPALVFAQQNQTPAVSLRVKRLATTRVIDKNWETEYGSYDRDYTKTLSAEIQIYNLRTEDAQVTLEWYFVAVTAKNSLRWIFDSGQEDVVLTQKKPFKADKTSADLTASVQKYVALGIKDAQGGRPDGYIVRVMQGEKVIAVAGSSSQLERIGRDAKELAKLLEE